MTKRFFSDVQRMVNQWLLVEGHSIGIGDTIADAATYKEAEEKLPKESIFVALFE